MRFYVSQIQNSTQFQFTLFNDANTALLNSVPFPNRDACVDAIRDAIQNLPNNANFRVENRQGNHFYAFRNNAGTLVSTSPNFTSQNQANTALASLINDASDETEYRVELATNIATTTKTRNELPKLVDIDFEALYDMNYVSKSGKSGLETFQKDADKNFYFHVNDTDGKALLYSRGFDKNGLRDKRIRQVISAAPQEKRYEIVESKGRFYIKLKEKNGLEIARSRFFNNRKDAQDAVIYLRDSIPSYAAQYAEPEKKKKGNQYDYTIPTTKKTGFDSVKHNKQSFFVLNDSDGTPILYSQGYSGNSGRDSGIKSVIKSAGTDKNYELKDEKGKYFFILRGTNKNEIARSINFDSANKRKKAMLWMSAAVPSYAHIYKVDMTETKTKTTTQTEVITLDVQRPKKIEIEKKVETPAPQKIAPVTVVNDKGKKDEKGVNIEKKPVEVPKPIIIEKATVANTARTFIETPASKMDGSPAMGNWLWWLLGALVLAGLLFFWGREGCQNHKVDTVVTAPLPIEPPKPVVSNTPTAAPEINTKAVTAATITCDLHWILFDFDRFNLLSASKAELDNMSKILKENKDFVAVLNAHTDSKGSDAYNKQLSNNRANEAKKYLMSLGIEGKRIDASASGKDDPIAKNTEDDSGRRFNRRVELFIKDKDGKNICSSIAPDVPTDLKNN